MRNCVASALAQSYPNIEVLVSDNASTDDTLATLKSIDDKRLRVLSNPEDIGMLRNFAKCVQEARGDYLVLVSGRQYSRSRVPGKMCAARQTGTRHSRSCWRRTIFWSSTNFPRMRERHRPRRSSKKLSTGIWHGTEILQRVFQRQNISPAPLSSIIRTDILRRNDLFSTYPCAGDDAIGSQHCSRGEPD